MADRHSSEQGSALLTGDAGSGKTILVNALVDSVAAENVIVGRPPYPGLEPCDFFRVIGAAYVLPTVADTGTRS